MSLTLLILLVVSAANIYKFRKQFTTLVTLLINTFLLFQLQIYTNFESNSQLKRLMFFRPSSCFSCKYIQISKAIHNEHHNTLFFLAVVSAANIYKFRKQFTTRKSDEIISGRLFQLQIYTNFESNSQQYVSC